MELFDLLQSGALDASRQASGRRLLVRSPLAAVRCYAARLFDLPSLGQRMRLLRDPDPSVRVEMQKRADLTPKERMVVCRKESEPALLRNFYERGDLSPDELDAITSRTVSENPNQILWSMLRDIAADPKLPNDAQTAIARSGDAVFRADLARSEHLTPDAAAVLFADPSPSVSFALLDAGNLDADRRKIARTRLVHSPSHTGRGLAAQLIWLREKADRSALMSDPNWTVRAVWAMRYDLLRRPSERAISRSDPHPGVRRAFASRPDLSDDEAWELASDSRRGVVSAIAYNRFTVVRSKVQAWALDRLESMEWEALPLKLPVTRQAKPDGQIIPGVPIVGFKAWELKSMSILCSWWRDEMWDQSIKFASCADRIPPEIRLDSAIPHPRPHDCGLYASHNPQDPRAQGSLRGVVLGRGHLIVHQQAWRAQQMEIVALCATLPRPSLQEAADAAGAILNVPVVTSLKDLEWISNYVGQRVTKPMAAARVDDRDRRLKSFLGIE